MTLLRVMAILTLTHSTVCFIHVNPSFILSSPSNSSPVFSSKGVHGFHRHSRKNFDFQMSPNYVTHVAETTSDLSRSLAEYIAKQSADSVKRKGRFSIAFSGGSLPKLACSDLSSSTSVAWDKWDIFFVDERCVPLDHADSNYKSLKENLLDKLSTPIPSSNVFAYDPSSSSPEDAAHRYAEAIISKVPPNEGGTLPSFDLILLGMGEDGHTASLFPGHPLLKESKKLVAHITDSPKPPPERITLTYPLIRAAKEVVVVAAGAGKAELLAQILNKQNEGSPYPVQLACDSQERLQFYIDRPAAALCNQISG